MQPEDIETQVHSREVQKKRRKKPKVRFSSRKTIVQNRMRRSKTKCRLLQGDASVAKTLIFEENVSETNTRDTSQRAVKTSGPPSNTFCEIKNQVSLGSEI